jgi:hypothetical protein
MPNDKSEKVLVFLCTELRTRNFRNVLRQFGAEWRSKGAFNEHTQHDGMRPLFWTVFELHNTAAAAMMDVKPANFALRPD